MIDVIKDTMVTHSDSANAVYMKMYMKDKFEFLGIKSPERRELLKSIISQHGLPDREDLSATVKGLWKLPEREYQYVAMEIFRKFQKKMDQNDVKVIEYLIKEKSWWDTVDFIASNLAGPYFVLYRDMLQKQYTAWMASENMWLQRTCLLFQLKYKGATNEKLLFDTIHQLKISNEFFIRKAIGWSLREYSKTNPSAVKSFVRSTTLSQLSTKEALRLIDN